MTTELSETKTKASGVERGKGVTFTFSRDFRLDRSEITACITNALHAKDPTIPIVPSELFLRTAFPDLAPDAAPRSAEYLALLLNNETFHQRIAPLGLRYIVSLSGVTEQREEAPIGVPRIAGGVVWKRETRLMASLIDLKAKSKAGAAEASATGHPWFSILAVPPFLLVIPATTEAQACRELGVAVARLIVDTDASARGAGER